MTSATTTRARGMGRRHAEGYGLIVFASVLLLVPDDLVPDDHRGRRGRATEPVCLWQPREPDCLALLCVDRPQLAGSLPPQSSRRFGYWRHLLVSATATVLFLFPCM
jgi:hypothetical protein